MEHSSGAGVVVPALLPEFPPLPEVAPTPVTVPEQLVPEQVAPAELPPEPLIPFVGPAGVAPESPPNAKDGEGANERLAAQSKSAVTPTLGRISTA